MNLLGIEAFLAIVDTQSITKASDLLYLSQSTISHRLKSLEKELDTVLILRKNGQRTISLTQKGEEFVPIARKWIALEKSTQLFKTEHIYPTFTVGSVDSLNLYVFSSLYNQILNDRVPIKLDIKSHHYSNLYMLIEKKEIDIGFVTEQMRYKNIITTPLFSEPMFVVSPMGSSLKAGDIHPSELNPKNEVFLSWGVDYQRWHDYWWNPAISPYVHVNAPSFIFNFMNNPECWTIVPISIAKIFEKLKNFKVHSISDPPPDRVCYKLTHRSGNLENSRCMEIFENYLNQFLSELEWKTTDEMI